MLKRVERVLEGVSAYPGTPMAVGLSLAPTEYPQLLAAVKNTNRRLARASRRPRLAWIAEVHDTEPMHLHALALDAEHITESAWRDAWGARVRVKPAYDPAGWMDYSLKGTRTFEGIQHHLSLNGGRVVHTSRSFHLQDRSILKNV